MNAECRRSTGARKYPRDRIPSSSQHGPQPLPCWRMPAGGSSGGKCPRRRWRRGNFPRFLPCCLARSPVDHVVVVALERIEKFIQSCVSEHGLRLLVSSRRRSEPVCRFRSCSFCGIIHHPFRQTPTGRRPQPYYIGFRCRKWPFGLFWFGH